MVRQELVQKEVGFRRAGSEEVFFLLPTKVFRKLSLGEKNILILSSPVQMLRVRVSGFR